MKYAAMLFLVLFSSYSFSAKTLEQLLEERGDPRERGKAKEHYIDPYRVERLEKRADFSKECKGIANLYKEMDCRAAGDKKWKEEYPDRGTVEYSRIHYLKLKKEQAEATRDQLVSAMQIIAFTPKTIDTEKTELLVEHLHREVIYIEETVLKVEPRDYRPYK